MTVSSSGLWSIFESLQCGGDYSMVFFLKNGAGSRDESLKEFIVRQILNEFVRMNFLKSSIQPVKFELTQSSVRFDLIGALRI